jgi:hypothetical protein
VSRKGAWAARQQTASADVIAARQQRGQQLAGRSGSKRNRGKIPAVRKPAGPARVEREQEGTADERQA